MKKKPKPPKNTPSVAGYERAQSPAYAAVCRFLRKQIELTLPKADSKIYHRIPVWFVGENAVVGYAVRAKGVNLLFWNGQAFKEPGLKATGSFKAAEAWFKCVEEIDGMSLRRWLKKAGKDIWDFHGLRQSL